MISSAQLPLEFGHRPAMGREDFLVAPCNGLAVEWIDRWPDWPGRILALHGPAGAGKSHLAEVWKSVSGAYPVTEELLAKADPIELVSDHHDLLLEDADLVLARFGMAEQGLLHLVNSLRVEQGSLLVTALSPPSKWKVSLPDLASRLAAVQSVGLGLPDDGLVEALLVKLFHDRQLSVSPEVVAFLLRRMERSFAAAQAIVDGVDRLSLSARREITIPLAREVLAALPDQGAEGGKQGEDE